MNIFEGLNDLKQASLPKEMLKYFINTYKKWELRLIKIVKKYFSFKMSHVWNPAQNWIYKEYSGPISLSFPQINK